mgnify:CR=1 FL=1
MCHKATKENYLNKCTLLDHAVIFYIDFTNTDNMETLAYGKPWRKFWLATFDFWLVTFDFWPLTSDLWLVYSVLYSYIHSKLRQREISLHQARVILSDHKIVRYWSCMIMAWIGQILLELWALESQRLLYLKGFTLYHLNFITSHHNIYCI